MIPAEWPAPRTWTVSAQYERVDPSTIPPSVRLAIEYGIGAAAYQSDMAVSAAGLVMGVTAQSIAANSRVMPNPLGGGGTVKVRVSVTPGPPLLGIVSQVVPYGTFAPAGLARAIAPRGAVAVVVTTQPYNPLPVAAPDGQGYWTYILPGGVGIQLSPVITLAQTVGPNTYRVLEMGVSVPPTANALTLQDVGPAGYHYLTWRVLQ
ncbi:MAG TPA: hypothetical protein PLP66_03875 [Phycisphaerae bacterium]|nr:hypothetical protein [Phycisphaerae bacterium]